MPPARAAPAAAGRRPPGHLVPARLVLRRHASCWCGSSCPRTKATLYVADTTTGALTPIEAGKSRGAGIRSARFAANGRSVYVLTDEDGEVAQLKLWDPLTHEDRRITPASPWDVEDFDVSADGRYVAYVLNEDGRSRLSVLDTLARTEIAPPGIPEGLIGNPRFDKGGTRLAMSVETRHRAARCLRVRHRAQQARALDAQRGRAARCEDPGRAGAGALPDLGPRGRPRAHALRLRVPPAAERRRAGADRHPRRPGGPVAPGLWDRSSSSW